MKIALLFSGLFFAGINFSSCQINSIQETKEGKISVDEFEQKINSTKNAQLIDVRTPEEYAKGYLKGARNINWNGSTFETEINKLDKNQAVFVYCLGGGRSAAAAVKIKELGFKEIYDMQGGITAWNSAGKPTVTSNIGINNPGMSLEEYNKQLKSDKLILIDFNAPWCTPCKKMAPMLEELSKEQQGKMELIKINVDENKELTQTLKIAELPVLILYKNKKILWQKSGMTEKSEIQKALKIN
jgi:thioredoxin 1